MIKFLIKTVVLLLFPIVVFAQDTVVTITPSMFNKELHECYITITDGWVFKPGNDAAWSQNSLDVSSWKKMKPSELSIKNADKNGKVEGWFRIKIKLDESFGSSPLSIKVGTWAATELYIDAKQVVKTGNTGANGKPYQEHTPWNNLSYPAGLLAGKEYTLALHFVDYVSPMVPGQLKSERMGLKGLIRITDTEYDTVQLKNLIQSKLFGTLYTSVTFILCLLFWLLYFQNPLEKNLRLIAFGSTALALNLFFGYQGGSFTPYLFNEICKLANSLCSMFTLIFTLLILVSIFKRTVTTALKAFLILLVLAWWVPVIISLFTPVKYGNIINLVTKIALIGVCIYYIISSWKTLKGAQWSIVVGIIITLLSGISFVILGDFGLIKLGSLNFYLCLACFSFSFPLSLLVYISGRFKEIIEEVRMNASQVVQLSEEKKEQAEKQQKLLEEEVANQTMELRASIQNLKATQSQLIQSEKMASLGELTAGIAHEIQNPLNFVNNFSEVSNELIQEIKEERAKNIENRDEALVSEILDDITQNLEKINHHGKRADAIVKGMLQHSRSSSAIKEPTDINKLADEYLRLAYHGLRAKDTRGGAERSGAKSFNVTMNTEFDETIGNINIIPQDIGRVILNLITNAFYAAPLPPEGGFKDPDYVHNPTVWVSTKKTDNQVLMSVRDNGPGIPQKILDKIFQPFFTTKPTGQGTGLGLSLAYDIVKAHGGELKVETIENEGTIFIILLPIS
jgi:signal transduction histidine kinase